MTGTDRLGSRGDAAVDSQGVLFGLECHDETDNFLKFPYEWIFDKVGDYWTIKSADDDRLYMALDKNNHLQLLTAIHYWDIRKVPGSAKFR